ncbi:MAG: aa3-type cytochrome c oxidase subunit IV [Alphaproteobacteria bacterium]|nr:MAG: aa3-type cytochrome c oxidase subunit IV [Alphaproteobacteria bacterium]
MADETNPEDFDISEHEKAFHGLVRVLTYGAAAAILVLIFLALVNS